MIAYNATTTQVQQMNKVKYDPEVDAAYLKIKDGEYIESGEIIDGVILHHGEDGSALAVELIGMRAVTVEGWEKVQSLLPTQTYKEVKAFLEQRR